MAFGNHIFSCVIWWRQSMARALAELSGNLHLIWRSGYQNLKVVPVSFALKRDDWAPLHVTLCIASSWHTYGVWIWDTSMWIENCEKHKSEKMIQWTIFSLISNWAPLHVFTMIFYETDVSKLCTGLGISFQTLEMCCLWWTGSSQKFFEEIPNEKKYHPHIIWKF